MRKITLLQLLSVLVFHCDFSPGQFNPENSNYLPPSFIVVDSATTAWNNDTSADETFQFTLEGTCDVGMIRWKIDTSEWSLWASPTKGQWTIIVPNLVGGDHQLNIQVCYDPDSDITDSIVMFHRAVQPVIEAQTDQPVSIAEGSHCTLWIKTKGTPPLHYQWYRNGTAINVSDADWYVLENASVEMTGVYTCKVINKWGETISNEMMIRIGKEYSVTYHGNGNDGGSVPIDKKRYTVGQKVTVSANDGVLTKSGYVFIGWNRQADGLGKHYASETTFAMETTPVTLYAQWTTEPTFQVLYHGNGSTEGTVPEDDNQYPVGATVTVSGNVGTLENGNMIFTGWNTVSDGSGVHYPEGSSFTIKTETVTLYAQWDAVPPAPAGNNDTLIVIFKSCGNTGGDSISVVRRLKGISFIIPDQGNLEKYGYDFIGWNTDTCSDGPFYIPGDQIIESSSDTIIFYARWAAGNYSLIYDCNGCDGGAVPPEKRYDFGASVIVAANTGNLAKTNNTLACWNSLSNGRGIDYPFDTTIRMDYGPLKLFAKWKPDQYAIIYKGNGTMGGVDIDSLLYDTGSPVCVATIGNRTRTGYSFVEWNTEADGSGQQYHPGDTFTINTTSITFYAQWTPETPAAMIRIASKDSTFFMGQKNDNPGHEVSFTFDFWMDSTEVTQKQYIDLMAAQYPDFNPPPCSLKYGLGDDYPVYFINWYDAVLYCNERTKASGSNDTVYVYNSVEGVQGKNNYTLKELTFDLHRSGFRLPTEAEWEYACRAGTHTHYYNGSNTFDAAFMKATAWYLDNADSTTHPVAQKRPNGNRLYDMYGNVWEWCNDWYGNYDGLPQIDPCQAIDNNTEHLHHKTVHGGGFANPNTYLGSTTRGFAWHHWGASSEIGFRCIQPIPSDY